MNQQTIDMLTDMKLSAMATEFAAQLKDSSFNALSFEERFSMAVTTEWNKRQTNKVNRLIKKAHLGAPETKSQGLFHQIHKEVTFCGLPHGAYA